MTEFKCKLCGTSFSGESAPANCFNCGALNIHITDNNDADIYHNIEVNETDISNVQHAFELEGNLATFCAIAAEMTENDESKKLFETLSNADAEHSNILIKILKDSSNSPTIRSLSTSKKLDENLKELRKKKTTLIQFYKDAELESMNQKLKTVYKVLIEIEEQHLTLF
ncbi:ferritin family protein [Elusimicrobiota bacterium]